MQPKVETASFADVVKNDTAKPTWWEVVDGELKVWDSDN